MDIAAAVNATLGVARFKPGVTRKIIQSFTVNARGQFVTFTDGTEHDVSDWEEFESLMPGCVMLFAPSGETIAAPATMKTDFLE